MPAPTLKIPRTSQHAATPNTKAPSLSPNEAQTPTISGALREIDRRQRRIDALERALDAKQRRIEALERALAARQRRESSKGGAAHFFSVLGGGAVLAGIAYLGWGAVPAAVVAGLTVFALLPLGRKR